MAAPTAEAPTGASVARAFAAHFPDAAAPRLAFAPGRVNLIGDHVDYCGGTVLPMPIEQGTWVAAAANESGMLRAVSVDREPALAFPLDRPPRFPDGHWGRFLHGALAVLEADGAAPTGADVLVTGNIPCGGLSSSASLSVALLLDLDGRGDAGLTGLPLARAAQRIEHEHVGVACGLMDQAAVVLGEAGAALEFHCADATASAVPIPEEEIAILVADSGVPRTLAGSAYNERRDALTRAAELAGIEFTRLATSLQPGTAFGDAELERLARHVTGEQARVEAACAAARAGDWPRFGRLLDASHASLRDDYAVSCPALDRLAEAFRRQPGCFGARLTGAGFGGAVVAAVRPDSVAACLAAVTAGLGADSRGAFRARSRGGARRGE